MCLGPKKHRLKAGQRRFLQRMHNTSYKKTQATASSSEQHHLMTERSAHCWRSPLKSQPTIYSHSSSSCLPRKIAWNFPSLPTRRKLRCKVFPRNETENSRAINKNQNVWRGAVLPKKTMAFQEGQSWYPGIRPESRKSSGMVHGHGGT